MDGKRPLQLFAGLLIPEQRRQFGSHFIDYLSSAVPEPFGAACFPIKALQMIR